MRRSLFRTWNDLKRYDLSDFYGNEPVRRRLTEWLDAGRLPHCLLVTGPDGCGRGFLARTLAAAWLNDTADLVARNIHPDCLTVSGEGASGLIPVRQIRDLVYELHKAPVMTEDRRVGLLGDVSRLNASSSNALLKALEEPPVGRVFLLCARSADNLIETVRSRCVVLTLAPLGQQECLQVLLQRYPDYDGDRLADLSRTYGGRLGLIVKALEVPGRLEIYDRAKRLTAAALRADKLDVMAALDSYTSAKSRTELKELLYDSTMMLAPASSGPDAQSVTALYDRIIETMSQIDRYINPKILAAWLAAGISN